MTPAQADEAIRTLEVAPVMTVPTTAPATVDLAAFLAQGQALLASLQPAAPVAPAAPAPAAPAPAPAAPALTGLAKAQAFWKSDYAGKGVPVRQLASGTWVDVKGAFCKAPKAAPKTQRAPEAPRVAPVSAVPAGPGITLEQLERLLAALGGAPAVAAAAAPAAAAVVAAVTPGIREQLVDDGKGWLHCPACESAYWGAFRSDDELARKYGKHVAKAHAS
ncbi:MAG TPA: hypothetical protein VGJ60_07115 [Chloroflexota bacterium]